MGLTPPLSWSRQRPPSTLVCPARNDYRQQEAREPVRAAAILVAIVLMAGCFSSRPTDSDPTSQLGGSNPTGTGGKTPLVDFGDWADPDDAEIRPGARVVAAHLACTANFLFRSPDNRSLYLGVASHCFGLDPAEAVDVGTPVTIAGIRNAGTVAYSGWAHDEADDNDFGLVLLSNSPAVRARVSPAMLYYGGPTQMGATVDVESGDLVMTYGNSVQRDEDDPENPREGYVVREDSGLFAVLTEQGGVPGDSGSGLMTFDGQAVGILSTGVVPDVTSSLPLLNQAPSVNYYCELDLVLVKMATADPALANLQLVTWPLLRNPSLPSIDPPAAGWDELPREYL